MGNFGGFSPFSQKVFNSRPLNMVYRHIVGTFKCVCKMAPMGQFFGPFLVQNRAEMCQYVGFCLFS